MTGRRRATADDEGQVLLLTIGYALVALLLVTAVVSATGVHLERKRLLALADQTALAAATALDEQAYYGRDDGGGLVRLTERSATDAALAHLAVSPSAARLPGLRVVDVRTDGRTVDVTLAALARPALVSVVTAPWSDGIAMQVTASARAG